ncbi:hypothetical protein DICA1_E23662 [Diutina catenulata]
MRVFKAILAIASVATAFPLFPDGIDFGSNGEERVLKLGPNSYKLSNEDEKIYLKRGGINFIDVTNQISVDEAIAQGIVGAKGELPVYSFGAKQFDKIKKPPVYNYPKKAKFNKEVKKIHKQINIDGVRDNLAHFTSYHTRYYNTPSGLESAKWLYDMVANITAPIKDSVNLTQVHHKGWDQFSIIASISGKSTDKVVVGSHQDSANFILPQIMAAPGADDDGSGTVTVLEALRVIVDDIVTNGFKPHNTLEFHFYSAEEVGLFGSIDVFSRYADAKEVVVGMLQQDMTGYTQGTKDAGVEEHVAIITDYTSVALNDYIKVLIDTYLDIPWKEGSCGYACSDHGSALENGYPSAFIIEAVNPYTDKFIHSTMDTLDRLDFNHIRQHIMLTVAYAYELSSAKKLHK